MITPKAFSSSYEMVIDRTHLGRVMTLNSSEGPIKYVLPRSTIDGQTLIKSIRELLPGNKLVYDLETQKYNIEEAYTLKTSVTDIKEGSQEDSFPQL